ncbi:MAG: response regulator transcription factor [Candidatus Scatomorpha sp.]
MNSALVIEESRASLDLIKRYLAIEGFRFIAAENGEEGFKLLKEENPAIVFLSSSLPDISGFELCRRIRKESDVPIIMLGEKKELKEKLMGLNLGADDYLTKPFEPEELMARMRAVLRRVGSSYEKEKKILRFENLSIDLDSYTLKVGGQLVPAPPKEIELLYYLASHPNKVFTRTQILDEVWGFNFYGDSRTVDVHIKRLREKLSGASADWDLATVWGVGYKFELSAMGSNS